MGILLEKILVNRFEIASVVSASTQIETILSRAESYLGNKTGEINARPFESPQPSSRVFYRDGFVDILSGNEIISLFLHQSREKR